MNKFRFASIAMLVCVVVFSSIIIAQNNDTTEVVKQSGNQACMQECESVMCDADGKACNPSECTPEQMEACKQECQNQCDSKADCSDKKAECSTMKSECSTMKETCTK